MYSVRVETKNFCIFPKTYNRYVFRRRLFSFAGYRIVFKIKVYLWINSNSIQENFLNFVIISTFLFLSFVSIFICYSFSSFYLLVYMFFFLFLWNKDRSAAGQKGDKSPVFCEYVRAHMYLCSDIIIIIKLFTFLHHLVNVYVCTIFWNCEFVFDCVCACLCVWECIYMRYMCI